MPLYCFRQAEVQNLDVAIVGQLDVRRFQITMDNASVMRGLQCFGNLLCNIQGLSNGNSPPINPVGQCFAFDELEYE